ncbi:MAG: DGQHR domain-containing protein [Ignavibacteriae bacterium]|nr:DGQHR domain-containing protein [Ignavibacteriota bacterium]
MRVIELQRLENKVVLIGAITFDTLKDRLKFTERQEESRDPYSPDATEENSEVNSKYYQRFTQEKRVREISRFIENTFLEQGTSQSSIKTIFPSSMILAFDYSDSISEKEIDFLDLKYLDEQGLIVDGQHRFAAMMSLQDKHERILEGNDEKLKKISEKILTQIKAYKFNCTVLLNFDLWDQAQLFANVNFNQKQVNKSLYYDIFGSIPPDSNDSRKNQIYLAHDLAKYLNHSDKSPLKGFIKMLGTGNGFFSQAMFVESIMVHFRKRGVWSNIEEDFRNEGIIVKSLPRIFIGYFNALKSTFTEQWPKAVDEKYDSILCKTTGIGATVRLLGYLYKLLSDGTYPGKEQLNFQNKSLSEVQQVFESIFVPITNKGDQLFGGTSEYAGAGSAGLQSKLYKQLLMELGLDDK